jgi:hypothetical protein
MSNTKLFLGKERGYCVPLWFIPKAVQWITGRILPGDFMRQVLLNDLKNAVGYADDVSLECLSGIIKFFYNEAPGVCWGSPDAIKAWQEMDDTAHSRLAQAWADSHPEFMTAGAGDFEEVPAGVPDIITQSLAPKRSDRGLVDLLLPFLKEKELRRVYEVEPDKRILKAIEGRAINATA